MTEAHNKTNGQKDTGNQTAAVGGGQSSTSSNKTPGNGEKREDSVLAKAQDAGAGLAKQSISALKENAFTSFDTQRSDLAAGLHSLAGGIQQTGSSIRDAKVDHVVTSVGADLADGIATKVESISGYLEKQSFAQMGRDLKGFAREHPGVFVGGALILGIVASRFLRTGVANQALETN